MIEKASGLVLDTVALAAPAERGNSSTDLGALRGHEDLTTKTRDPCGCPWSPTPPCIF